MCWNADVSLKSWVFSLVGLAFGLWGGVEWRILLIGTIFSFMQFVEYNLWTHLKDPVQNKFWSRVGQVTVWAELFGAANVIEKSSLRTLFFGLSAVYIFVTDILLGKKGSILTTVGPNGHLQHNWYSESKLTFLMPLLLVIPFWLSVSTLWALLITATVLLSGYFYHRSGEFSSMWCYISLAFWLIVIFKSIGLDKYCALPKIE
jgi:hypothetical protein